MSGVNISPNYKQIMGLEDNEALLGGVVAVYYAGTLIGALLGKTITYLFENDDGAYTNRYRWLGW